MAQVCDGDTAPTHAIGEFGSDDCQQTCPNYNTSYQAAFLPAVTAPNGEHITGSHSWTTVATTKNTYIQQGGQQEDGWPCVCTASVYFYTNSGSESGRTGIDGLAQFPDYHEYTVAAQSQPPVKGDPGIDLWIAAYSAMGVAGCDTPGLECGQSVYWSNGWVWTLPPQSWWVWQPSYIQNDDCAAAWASQQGSPIVVDLDGMDFSGAFTSAEDGVVFSLFPAQAPVKTAWSRPGRRIGFLAVHRVLPQYGEKERAISNGDLPTVPFMPAAPPANWKIANSGELFGNFTSQRGKSGIRHNGFEALALLDTVAYGGNGDGVIDSKDQAWQWLRLWIDTSHTGDSTKGELLTMEQAGIKAISLTYRSDDRKDQYGNTLRYRGTVIMHDGYPTTPLIYDVYFQSVKP